MDLTKGNVNEFKNETKLDNAEKELYIKGSKTNESVSVKHTNYNNVYVNATTRVLNENISQFSKWLFEDAAKIQTADMVSNHRKRKRAALEI